MVQPYMYFWGKARPVDEGCGFHPVAWHSLDVAAVCTVLLRQDKVLREKFSDLLRLEEDDVVALLTVLMALHDVGKFSLDFQRLNEACWPSDVLGPDGRVASGLRHDAAGYVLWFDWLEGLVAERMWPDVKSNIMRELAHGVFGHHGKPVSYDSDLSKIYGAAIEHAQAFCGDVLDLFVTRPLVLEGKRKQKDLKAGSWFAAGFFVLCDWIGSNQNYFPYEAPDLPLDLYWEEYALKRAEAALAATGVIPSGSQGALEFCDIVGAGFAPSPLQQWAQTVEMPEGPGLFIIEDVTGAGKTEAAQVLAYRRMQMGCAVGAYWALPTQATTDAMFRRQAPLYERLFEAGSRPSIVLSHGKAKLNEAFTNIILQNDPHGFDCRETEEAASGACSAWIADDRRTAFLADVGVGTIDQAVLGILSSKFQSLRLMGLSRRALIVDEVHAFDSYLSDHIQTLLTFQAALGGDAILLSATLPTQLRQRLVDAYSDGLGLQDRPKLERSDYPLATVFSASGVREDAVEASGRSEKAVSVRRLGAPEKALDVMVQTAEAGGCGVYIRNTVDDVLESCRCLEERGLKPIVFHARMAQVDRLKREADILSWFGKDGTAEDRTGKIVIASPILQESLDIDFDVMVSDLAPMDLIIQRAGRWRRHEALRGDGRPAGLSDNLLIVSPVPVDDAREDWYQAAFPKGQYVYRNHAQLWLTAKRLFQQGGYRIPDDLRDMIEFVFAEDAFEEAPEVLHQCALNYEQEESIDASEASFSSLTFSKGYGEQDEKWDVDERVMTRLGADTTTLRLARVLDDGSLAPWAEVEGGHYEKAWALSELRVRQNQIPLGALPEERFRGAVEVLKEGWSSWKQDIVVVPVSGGKCQLHFENNKVVILSYTVDMGLLFE